MKKTNDVALLQQQTAMDMDLSSGIHQSNTNQQTSRMMGSNMRSSLTKGTFYDTEELYFRESELIQREENLLEDLEKEQQLTKSLLQKERTMERDRVKPDHQSTLYSNRS